MRLARSEVDLGTKLLELPAGFSGDLIDVGEADFKRVAEHFLQNVACLGLLFGRRCLGDNGLYLDGFQRLLDDLELMQRRKARQVAGLSEEIALSLGASSCRVHRHEGQVEVEVPRVKGKVVPLLPLCQRLAARGRDAIPPHTAVLGLDQEGVPLLLRLPSPNVAHVLIAGTTGSGKTALARSIVTSLALNNGQRSLQLVLIGTDFDQQVWKRLMQIPPGRAVTYSDIASSIERPRAQRAVGSAVGRNPISFDVPCHRVLRRDGGLGGYHWSVPRKQAIIGWEKQWEID